MDLAGLKTKAGNLDVDKIKTVPADLSKLSNVVYNGQCSALKGQCSVSKGQCY